MSGWTSWPRSGRHPQKITPAYIEFVDIAGLVRGASRGEGLGNKFLSHIREVDAIVHVVRCFEDSDIIHVDGSIDPVRDVETIHLELILADLETCEKRLEKAQKAARGNDKNAQAEAELLQRMIEQLQQEKPVRAMEMTKEEQQLAQSFFLLTTKPILYAANIAQEEIGKDSENVKKLTALAEKDGDQVLTISARIEEELTQLEPEERKLFLGEYGLTESGLDRLVKASYRLLGLISYLTAGETEVRAWTITKGTKAPQAAGKIHSDFERGFIRAEIISYDDFMKYGSYAAAREHGLVRSEGKEYIMQDGDITLFRFNV